MDIPDDFPLQLQLTHSKRRRNGKVARLPSHLRDQINRLLDDGLPYKTILEQLGEPGRHLNEDNLSNWRLGGYQDYLNADAIEDRSRAQVAAAAEVLRDTPDATPARLRETCSQIILLLYMRALMYHGNRLAQETLDRRPSKMITLMNSLCHSATAARLQRKQTAKK